MKKRENYLNEAVLVNQRHWDGVIEKYSNSNYYLKDIVLKGGISLSEIEVDEIGNVHGLSGVHVQCGIGLETISFSKLGASMVGLDFSIESIRVARGLANQCGANCEFIISNVLDKTVLPKREYDFAYASHGIFRWIPDIKLWAKNVSSLVRVGGFIYIYEIHPIFFRIQDVKGNCVITAGNYFDEKPKVRRLKETHLGGLLDDDPTEVVHFDWTLSSIVNALSDARFNIEFLNEHEGASYNRFNHFPKRHKNLWYPISGSLGLPCSFSLKANKM